MGLLTKVTFINIFMNINILPASLIPNVHRSSACQLWDDNVKRGDPYTIYECRMHSLCAIGAQIQQIFIFI